jgi:hypothetical protein
MKPQVHSSTLYVSVTYACTCGIKMGVAQSLAIRDGSYRVALEHQNPPHCTLAFALGSIAGSCPLIMLSSSYGTGIAAKWLRRRIIVLTYVRLHQQISFLGLSLISPQVSIGSIHQNMIQPECPDLLVLRGLNRS